MKAAPIDLRMRMATEDGLTAFAVDSEDGDVHAWISPIGATLLRWRVRSGDVSHDLVDGYRDAPELAEQAGARSGVMVPFTNRVQGGRYAFDGADHDLSGSAVGSPSALLHGFFRTRRFAPVESIATADSFMLRLRNHDLVEPVSAPAPGYPFAVGIDVVYVITRYALTLEITATNFGETSAPVTAGWHPYFTLGCAADDLVLHVDAASRVRTDSDLIPFDGAAGTVSLDDDEEFDFRTPRAVGTAEIDVCFTGLAPSADGLFHTRLERPGAGVGIDVWQERGSMHVYTADHLQRGRRGSIALEPVEALTNAFNRPDQADLLPLEPGRSRAFRCGVALVPSSGS